MIRDKAAIIKRLREVAVEIRGVTWVAAARARAIIGVSPAAGRYWVRQGYVRQAILTGLDVRIARHGRLRVWPLRDLIRVTRRMKSYMPWTREMDDLLSDQYGRRKPFAIANKLGVTTQALLKRARMLGLTQSQALGLWTIGEIAAELCVCPSTVRNWCKAGMRHQRTAAKSIRCTLPGWVIEFLEATANRNRLVRLPDDALERLRAHVAPPVPTRRVA